MTDQIKRIYEAMADKTLSFGCMASQEGILYTLLPNEKWFYASEFECYTYFRNTHFFIKEEGVKIIGHQVMIGDVIDYLEKQNWDLLHTQMLEDLFMKWKDKTKPIEYQPQECIDFVESLIPNL